MERGTLQGGACGSGAGARLPGTGCGCRRRTPGAGTWGLHRRRAGWWRLTQAVDVPGVRRWMPRATSHLGWGTPGYTALPRAAKPAHQGSGARAGGRPPHSALPRAPRSRRTGGRGPAWLREGRIGGASRGPGPAMPRAAQPAHRPKGLGHANASGRKPPEPRHTPLRTPHRTSSAPRSGDTRDTRVPGCWGSSPGRPLPRGPGAPMATPAHHPFPRREAGAQVEASAREGTP
jgi:hypothetical protein